MKKAFKFLNNNQICLMSGAFGFFAGSVLDTMYIPEEMGGRFIKNPIKKLAFYNQSRIACTVFGTFLGHVIEDIYKREFDLF